MSSWLDYLNWTGGNGFLFYFTSLILGMALVEGDGLERKEGRTGYHTWTAVVSVYFLLKEGWGGIDG